MPRFAANLSLLFNDVALPARFAAAAAAGFDGVEIQFPYDYPATTLAAAAQAAAMPVVLINVPAGDLMQGGPGLASHPARRADFSAALPQALDYARHLGVKLLNVLPGRLAEGYGRAQCEATLLDNLRHAAAFFAPHGIRLCCEAINHHDMPGSLLSTPDQLAAVLARLAPLEIGLQIDIYHAARMNLDIPAMLQRYLPQAAHVQFADYPGRGQPGSGSLPLRDYFDFIDKSAYCGWVGAEYKPSGPANAAQAWLTGAT